MGDQVDNPAALREHDPEWGPRAAQFLTSIRQALFGLPGAEDATYDHIGSTAVPGLAAKPFIDLQVRVLPLPRHAELTTRLEPLGFERARGARPDSPGVNRDIPRGDEEMPDEVWEKWLYVLRREGVILHVRRTDSPWGRYTVWFRDWLRAHPAERIRYEETKRELAEQNAGKPDYDDYTRARPPSSTTSSNRSLTGHEAGPSSAGVASDLQKQLPLVNWHRNVSRVGLR